MKVVDKKVGDKTYYRYRINLPKQIVEDSKLADKEVRVNLEEGKVIIKKR